MGQPHFLGESVVPQKVQRETIQRSGAPLQIPSIDEKTSSKAARDYALGASFATQETIFMSWCCCMESSIKPSALPTLWLQDLGSSTQYFQKQFATNKIASVCIAQFDFTHQASSSRFTSLTHVALQKRSMPSRCRISRGPHVPPATIHSSTLAWKIQRLCGKKLVEIWILRQGWRNHEKFHQTASQCLASVPVFAALKRPTKTPTSVALGAAPFTNKWRLWMAQWARFDKQFGKTEENLE